MAATSPSHGVAAVASGDGDEGDEEAESDSGLGVGGPLCSLSASLLMDVLLVDDIATTRGADRWDVVQKAEVLSHLTRALWLRTLRARLGRSAQSTS